MVPVEWGDSPRTAWGACHTYNILVPPGTYFKEHPEYFSEIDGKRRTVQLCLTDPAVEKIMLQRLLDHHKANPDILYYEISPNDGLGYCQCAKCTAVNKAAGGTEMGTLLKLINRVAEKVARKYPEVWITTLAYLSTVMPPTNAKPRDNVLITLCTDASAWPYPCLFVSESPVFKKALKAWHAAGANIRIWDYPIDFAQYMRPLPNMPVMTGNMRYYIAHGALGISPGLS